MKDDKDFSYPEIPDSDGNKNYPIVIDETEELKAEIVVLKSEISFLRKEITSLKEEIISLKEKIKQLKESNHSLSITDISSIKKLPNGNIEFGHYPQGENGKFKPIEWQILDKKDNRSTPSPKQENSIKAQSFEDNIQTIFPTKNDTASSTSAIKYLPDGKNEFGHYPQGKNGEIKPIEWQILDRKDNRILVISRYALDCQKYNSTQTSITWEKCTLRTWLNSTFINNAFSTGEKELIPSATVSAERNPEYSTSAGNSTTDKVFLLSITEANKYFRNDTNRACKPTEYAKAKVYTADNGNFAWWLRSPGFYSSKAAYIKNVGNVSTFGHSVDCSTYAVRPALWINLES